MNEQRHVHVLALAKACRVGLGIARERGQQILEPVEGDREAEREQIGERTRFALEAVAREGRPRSHRTPFGWKTATGSDRPELGERAPLVADPREQQLLARIFDLEGEGLGARRIAAALNAEGLLNPRTGRPWTFGAVAGILADGRTTQGSRDRYERLGGRPLNRAVRRLGNGRPRL